MKFCFLEKFLTLMKNFMLKIILLKKSFTRYNWKLRFFIGFQHPASLQWGWFWRGFLFYWIISTVSGCADQHGMPILSLCLPRQGWSCNGDFLRTLARIWLLTTWIYFLDILWLVQPSLLDIFTWKMNVCICSIHLFYQQQIIFSRYKKFDDVNFLVSFINRNNVWFHIPVYASSFILNNCFNFERGIWKQGFFVNAMKFLHENRLFRELRCVLDNWFFELCGCQVRECSKNWLLRNDLKKKTRFSFGKIKNNVLFLLVFLKIVAIIWNK